MCQLILKLFTELWIADFLFQLMYNKIFLHKLFYYYMYCVKSICENVVFLLLTSFKSDENEFSKKHTPVLADATCQTTDQGPGTQSCTDLTALDD